jgi:XTP/dITP diphosphohydrolase
MCVPRTLVIASWNSGKVTELRRLVETWGVAEVRGIAEFPDAREPIEAGATYMDNARIKAVSGAAATGLPALADDSGLEVDALGGRPGVHSARYGGRGVSSRDRIGHLLDELGGVPEARRGAVFRAVVVLAWPDGRTLEASGECRGTIASAPRGSGGFGYDPVFVHPAFGRTFAEVSPAEKARVDHRGHAMEALRGKLLAACAQTDAG